MRKASRQGRIAAPLKTIDLVIVALYLLGVIAAGAFFARRQKTTVQYFLGGRSMPWWAIAASIVATETSTITFISIPAVAFSRGGNFTFLQIAAGYVIGRLLVAVLFIPSYFKGELLTVYQLLQERFGGAVKGLSAALFIATRTIGDGIRLLLTALVLAQVASEFRGGAGEGLVAPAVVGLGAILILFTLWGGMEAVIWIEVVQFAIYLGGAVAALVILTGKIPGGFSAAMDLAAAHGKFRLLDFSLGGSGSYTTFWGGLLGGAVLTMSTHGTDQYLVQRYLCAEKPRKAAAALVVSGAIVFVQFAMFLTIGLLLFGFYRPDLLSDYATGAAFAPFPRPDAVFSRFIATELPVGITGLVIAAILAAALSSSLNAVAAAALNDLYRPAFPNRGDRHDLYISRIFTVVAGVLQIGVALAVSQTRRSALDAALTAASLFNGPILGVFLLAALDRRAAKPAALAGMAAGLVVAFSVWQATGVSWVWYSLIGSATTVLVGFVMGFARRAPA